MIGLGIICVIVGAIFKQVSILVPIGVLLVVVGLIFAVSGNLAY